MTWHNLYIWTNIVVVIHLDVLTNPSVGWILVVNRGQTQVDFSINVENSVSRPQDFWCELAGPQAIHEDQDWPVRVCVHVYVSVYMLCIPPVAVGTCLAQHTATLDWDSCLLGNLCKLPNPTKWLKSTNLRTVSWWKMTWSWLLRTNWYWAAGVVPRKLPYLCIQREKTRYTTLYLWQLSCQEDQFLP